HRPVQDDGRRDLALLPQADEDERCDGEGDGEDREGERGRPRARCFRSGRGRLAHRPPALCRLLLRSRSTSRRIVSRIESASCLLSAVMPLPGLRDGTSRSAARAPIAVSVTGWERWTPRMVVGIPWYTATWPFSTPTYHCRSAYTLNATMPATTTTTTPPIQMSRRRAEI